MFDVARTELSDERALAAALAEADVAPMLMVLVHLTGEEHWLDEIGPHIFGAWNFMEQTPEDKRARLRTRLAAVLQEVASGERRVPKVPPRALLSRMMSAGVGGTVPPEYIPLILEEMNLADGDPRTVRGREKPAPEALARLKVLIVGAGLSGLCMAIKLKEAGIDFEIVEKNDTVGGTWYENDYPGCGVDTPNHFFSFSFAPNHDWPDHFSKRNELWRYLEECADTHNLRRHIRFETEMVSAQWDESANLWRCHLKPKEGAEETVETAVLITAVGQLNRPFIPALEGLAEFKGAAFHTGKWDRSVDLAGKRVAMIGTGASGMQAGPSIAGTVGKLTVFQRTPHWSIYNPNYHARVSDGVKWALKYIPFYSQWYRFQLFWASADGLHASLQVDPSWPTPDLSLNADNQRFRDMLVAHMTRELDGDAALLKKVVPQYPPYGKRMLRDNHWFRMLKRPNVELVTERIARVEPAAIVTADGTRHLADVIVFATGFQAGRMLWPMEIAGRGGLTVREAWGDDDPRAHLGMTAPGFPNLFMLYGPNTNLGHGGSIIFHTECQVRYIMQALREMTEKRISSLECRAEPHDAYNERVDAAHRNMVWAHGGVGNWYKNARGRVIANSPWRLVDYWAMTKEFKLGDFELSTRS